MSVLFADLISLYALNILNLFRKNNHPYESAALTMLVAVGVFYPILNFLEKYLKKLSGNVLKKGVKITGNQFFGQFFGFLIAIVLLWIGYAHAIYNANPLEKAMAWITSI